MRDAFMTRLTASLSAWNDFLGRPPTDTVYLGGGTPSTLPTEDLLRISEALLAAFPPTPDCEATLEANPGSLSQNWLKGALRLGWNRLSLGIQSLDPALLEALGRSHDPDAALDALHLAREAHIPRISADLMLGIPGQQLQRVLEDASTLVAGGADHLSIYMLDLDKASPLSRRIDAGEFAPPAEDELADTYLALHDRLRDLGLPSYEISNFARPGQESRHNLRYWQRRPYLGLGPSAASQMADLRWTEPSDLRAWIDGAAPLDLEELSPQDQMAEVALLGLRTTRGIPWEALRSEAEASGFRDAWLGWETALAPLRAAGLLEETDGYLRLTPKGMLLGNTVFRVFV